MIFTILSCENPSNIWESNDGPQMCGANKLTVKWSWFYRGMGEFNCLVVVHFSAMFSCFLFDSFELQEMVCFTKHGATFSTLNISRRYDEHACDTIFFPYAGNWRINSVICSHHILQESSELWSCNFTGFWQFDPTSALVSTWFA